MGSGEYGNGSSIDEAKRGVSIGLLMLCGSSNITVADCDMLLSFFGSCSINRMLGTWPFRDFEKFYNSGRADLAKISINGAKSKSHHVNTSMSPNQ